MSETTFDTQALKILIAGGPKMQARLDELKAQADRMHGHQCPECDGQDIDSNDAGRMSERTYLCNGCGHQWDAVV